VQDLAERAKLDAKDLSALASGGALKSLASNRHRARWEVSGVQKVTPLFDKIRIAEGLAMLRRPSEREDMRADYRHLGLSLGRHPLALVRNLLKEREVLDARSVAELADGARAHAAGLVITRQRPSSAAGVVFVTLEDETGYLNLIVWDSVVERFRRALLGAALLGVTGKVQKDGAVLHVIAERLFDLSSLLGDLATRSRDFH
jgi:error-prone DNA polymerase